MEKRLSAIGLDLAKSFSGCMRLNAAGGSFCAAQNPRRAQPSRVSSADSEPLLGSYGGCSVAHFLGSAELGKLGAYTRLMPPSYVKPMQVAQTDAADAEAICEAVTRTRTMRFVPVKTEEQASDFDDANRARDFLVRQLTQVSNALRAHLGIRPVVPKGVQNIERLVTRWPEATGLPPMRLQFRLASG